MEYGVILKQIRLLKARYLDLVNPCNYFPVFNLLAENKLIRHHNNFECQNSKHQPPTQNLSRISLR
jgi:hypothetical protein